MSLLDELRKARTDSAQVAYQNFALHTGPKSQGLFCFFEGKGGTDNPYYVPRIKHFIREYHPILCGGRETVLNVHRLIKAHSEYNKYRKAFFIDKDFNDVLPPQIPPVFETDCYSVENYYVSELVFGEILKNSLGISEVEDIYDSCINLFKKLQSEYHEATLLFNSWYACLIDIRNSVGTKTGVNLDKRLPNGFVRISINEIKSNYDLSKIRATFPNSTFVSDEDVNKKIEIFRCLNQHEVFRGKFELDFVLNFFELLVKDSASNQLFVKRKVSFPFGARLSNDQAISIFSAYAETPDKLYDYLSTVVK